MFKKSLIERVATCIAFLSVGVLVSGTDACQTDYSVGGQSEGPVGTGTPTTGPTETPTEVGTGTPDGTATPQTTGTAQSTDTPEATDTPDQSAQALGVKRGGLLDELSQAAEKEEGSGAAAGAGAGCGCRRVG